MRNPWLDLPTRSPWVLAGDAAHLAAFNRHASEAHRIDLELLPEPFFGHFDAPVVVLLLNPGIGDADQNHHRLPAFVTALRAHLDHAGQQPHFHLADPTRGPGHDWWQRGCRSLIRDAGIERVAARLLALEFMPYHSRSFAHAHLRLPWQDYTFEVLRTALRRNAWVVCVRGLRFWEGAVPELANHSRLILPNNRRAAHLSPGNLARYNELLAAIRA